MFEIAAIASYAQAVIDLQSPPKTDSERKEADLRKQQQRQTEEIKSELRAMESRLRIHNICSRYY